MTDRCDLTELFTDQCAHCTGHTDAPPTVDPAEVSHTFEARWRGACTNCDRWFEEGDTVGRLADGGGYVCPRCLP